MEVEMERRLKLSVWQEDDIRQLTEKGQLEGDGNWQIYSFSPRHANFRQPGEFNTPEFKAACAAGLAFVLSYYEHGQSMWMLYGEEVPGVEFRWDGRRVAGVLIWEEPEENIGAKTPEERREDAAGFIRTYNAIINGDVAGYTLSVEERCEYGEWHETETVDSCSGFVLTGWGREDEYFTNEIMAALTGNEECRGLELAIEGDWGEPIEQEIQQRWNNLNQGAEPGNEVTGPTVTKAVKAWEGGEL
jgi:hypothetical protein